MILFHFQDVSYPLEEDQLREWIDSSITSHGKTPAEINFIFLSDEELLQINRKHLQHDYYTDVITFDYCVGDIISGDIYISLDRVRENALTFNEPEERELYRVMIHGVLHLLGFGDKEEDKQREMRNQEEILLTLCPVL